MSEAVVLLNRLARKVQNCAKVQYALAAALLLALGVSYFGIYRPQDQETRELNREIESKQLELISDRSQTDRLPRVAGELAELKTRLAGFKKLPPDPQYGNFIHDINRASSKSVLTDWSEVPGPVLRNELYSEQPIQLSFEGDFRSAFAFIRQVEDMERLTRVRDVTMASTDPRNGRVKVTVTVNIYYSEGG
jgi:Tfp pilus assembly protein PilO